jgi:2-methylcitrate dehydratase PrpD
MKHATLLLIGAALLLCHAAVLCADEQPAIDPESADDITLALSKLAIETKADDLSEEAYTAAKKAVLDALGCAMAGYEASGVPAVVEMTKDWGGREEATIWFHGGKVPGPAATFANSVQTHALDLDDFHKPSITHITSVIVPAAFAMGEHNDATGKETLASIILGIEVAGRLGRACRGLHAHQGFLPTSVMGGFGATATACRLQGCTVEETVHAMGIWYAHCSGNRQALYDRTLTKRIQPAIAARAGVFASGVNSGMVGVPWTDSETPQAMAQFCAPYEIASVIKNRRFGPAEIAPERIAEDREVDALARRCELHQWKDWGGPRPAFQAVRIFLKDGRKLEAWHDQEEVLSPTSHTYQQLVDKFKYNVTFSGLVNERRADEMVKAIENLDACERIRDFVRRHLVN